MTHRGPHSGQREIQRAASFGFSSELQARVPILPGAGLLCLELDVEGVSGPGRPPVTRVCIHVPPFSLSCLLAVSSACSSPAGSLAEGPAGC